MPTLEDFRRDYWAPDRDDVLARMQQEADAPQRLTTPGGPVGGGGTAGQFQFAPAPGPFNETALSQAWLGSGGRTLDDWKRFQQNNANLFTGTTIAGSKGDKVVLPDGRVIDAVLASGLGGQGAQWNVEGPGGGGGYNFGGGLPGGYSLPNLSYGGFTAPTGLNFQNDPGYQARMQMGLDAITKSAAARGNFLTGGTMKDLNQFAQDFASNEYGNVFNRALQGHQTNFNNNLQTWLANSQAAQQQWQNQYLAQQARFNQLFSTAGLGQQGVNQLAGYGQGYANQLAAILQNQGNNATDLLTGQGNALAAGQIGSGQAWAQGLGGVGDAVNMAMLYRALYGQNPVNTTPPYAGGGGYQVGPGGSVPQTPLPYGPGNIWWGGASPQLPRMGFPVAVE